MKKKILDQLTTKFPGVAESILDGIAAKLAETVTTEDQVKTAVEGVTFSQVLQSYGDSRANQAQASAVKNYEKKYNLKDGKANEAGGQEDPNKTQPGAAGNGDQVPAWAQALIDSNKALKEELNTLKGDQVARARRTELGAILEQLPENLRKAYERTPVENLTEDEFATLKSEITTEVGDIVKVTNQKGAVFGRPSASYGGNSNEQQLSKEQIAQINQRPGAVTDGQPF